MPSKAYDHFGKVSDLMDSSQSPSHPHQQVVRRGRVSWLTQPPEGVARISVESRAFGALGVSVPEDDPIPNEATPGELLAITHGMCMALVLSQGLAEGGSSANELTVEVECTFAGPGPIRELIAVDLDVRGRVPGFEAARFREAADDARLRYLRLIGARDDVPGELEAVLETSGGGP
jgi:lipoyl-dependent peroxiredoxin